MIPLLRPPQPQAYSVVNKMDAPSAEQKLTPVGGPKVKKKK